MAIPSAVKVIGDAAEAAAQKAGMAGAPGVDAANPGDTPPLVVVPDPVATPVAKVDPDDYKERFSRYKTQTDQTITDLRASLAASQQTITALQGQVQTLGAQANAAPKADPATPVTLPADLSNDENYKAWLDRLPNDKSEYEDSFLRFQYGVYLAGQQGQQPNAGLEALEDKVNRVAQVQDKTAAQLYEEAMDVEFPDDQWIKLASGSDWQNFCQQQVSDVDARTYGAIVKEGSDSHSARTVTWVLKQYQQYQHTLDGSGGGTVVDDPLAAQVTPGGTGGGGGDPIQEANAKAMTYKLSEVTEFYKEVATGNKYTAEQAAAIEIQIQAAQAAGKIITG
jgi:hypothetical protein